MIRNKKILITGGSSGLGLALAERLAVNNQLVLVARDPSKLKAAVEKIHSQVVGAKVEGHSIDVTDASASQSLVGLVEKMGGLDLLINSAGILREGYFEALSEKDFHDTLQINFFGTVNTIRALLPEIKRSRGQIVNIASIAGLTGVFGYSAYCSSKHALMGFTESLRFELAPKGVNIQIVCPPEFDSPMVEALDLNRTPENKAHVQTIPKMTLDHCADEIVKGMNSKRYKIIPGAQSKIVAMGIQHFSGLSRWFGARKISLAQKQKA